VASTPGSEPTEPTDDSELRRALLDAELLPLLPALAHLTGDLTLVDPDLLDGWQLPDPGAGTPGVPSAPAQERALDALRRLRHRPPPPQSVPDTDTLRRLMEFITGPVDDDYLPLLAQELGLPEGVVDSEPPVDLDGSDFVVAVIGAGMSGLAAARGLARAGVRFVVLERNRDVGGVWLQNSYPGCRLDTNNFAYSYSFAQTPDWKQQYSTRAAILEYFQEFAADQGLHANIRFDTTVVSASFDEDDRTWTLELVDGQGRSTSLVVNAVISAVGQLNRPRVPAIPGRERFAGPAFHSACWDHDVDLTGRQVAVIGTGASGYQVIPSIADRTARLTVFQRSAPWALPAPGYHEDVAPGLRWLFQNVPGYHSWYRFHQFWMAVEGMRKYAVIDPEWSGAGSVSAANDVLRSNLVAYLEKQYADRPDLLEKVVPDYPPYAKRMLRDNGVWARTLKQDHVDLVTEEITEITERGVRTSGGTEHPAEVIIYATGFEASHFLNSVKVTGRRGLDLHEWWAGNARAYLGMTIPNFPNLFCVYGPNTNLVLNGSIIMFSELSVQYILRCIALLLARGHRALECRPAPFERYNRRVDAGNRLMAWGLPGVNNWYKNASGRVSQNWPFPTLEYWRATRAPDPDDYDFL
jgi:4-hydroxyacetophenone monooxygenase